MAEVSGPKLCTTCGVNPVIQGFPARYGLCKICRRKTTMAKVSIPISRSSEVGSTGTCPSIRSEIDRLKQMMTPVEPAESCHLYVITSAAHELIQKFKIGITSHSLEQLVNECTPYMMEPIVHRFHKLVQPDRGVVDRFMVDLHRDLSQYKCDQPGWYEGKKDVLAEIVDSHVHGLYEGHDDQFVVDLIHLGQAVAGGADKLELRLKLVKLIESGRAWLNYTDPPCSCSGLY